MADTGGSIEGRTLEYTPTWVVAVVCCIIIIISLIVEWSLHKAGDILDKRKQHPLHEALQKIKDELMLLGFISLLLAVFQTRIGKICISPQLANKWLPCKDVDSSSATVAIAHFLSTSFPARGRRLLTSPSFTEYCAPKGKVPLLSLAALHHIHIFIFVLAAFHVTVCVIIVGFIRFIRIEHWEKWEKKIREQEGNNNLVEESLHKTLIKVKHRVRNVDDFGEYTAGPSWLHSFFKQFHPSVTMSDYIILRYNFIMKHSRNPDFNFNKFMIHTVEEEADFKEVVGIRWYLWLFVVAFLLLNVAGWHAYFWISFFPLILLLVVGTKLEHIMGQITQKVAKCHEEGVEGPVDPPKDSHFWFRKPCLVLRHFWLQKPCLVLRHFWIQKSCLVLHLIHIALFQNSFELAIFFFVLLQYDFSSCIMGEVGYVIPRLIVGVFVQLFCCYSILPLYAMVKTQMQMIDDKKEDFALGKSCKNERPNEEDAKRTNAKHSVVLGKSCEKEQSKIIANRSIDLDSTGEFVGGEVTKDGVKAAETHDTEAQKIN